NTAKMPSEKPKSPILLTMKALIAAALASGLWNQKPIKKELASPTPSQPKNSCTRLSAVTSISMAKGNNDRYAKKRGRNGASAMWPMDYRRRTEEMVVTTTSMMTVSVSMRNAQSTLRSPDVIQEK